MTETAETKKIEESKAEEGKEEEKKEEEKPKPIPERLQTWKQRLEKVKFEDMGEHDKLMVENGRREEEEDKEPTWPEDPSWFVKELPADKSLGAGVRDFELVSGNRVHAKVSSYGATLYSVRHLKGEVPETWESKKKKWDERQQRKKE